MMRKVKTSWKNKYDERFFFFHFFVKWFRSEQQKKIFYRPQYVAQFHFNRTKKKSCWKSLNYDYNTVFGIVFHFVHYLV